MMSSPVSSTEGSSSCGEVTPNSLAFSIKPGPAALPRVLKGVAHDLVIHRPFGHRQGLEGGPILGSRGVSRVNT